MDILYPSSDTARSVAYTGTAGTTSTLRPAKAVMVWCTSDAYVRVGEGVTATSADLPLPAYQVVILSVPPGSGAPFVVSAIQISAGGTVYAKSVGGDVV